ncbi:unnamed protein product [Malus baccata var. baccata]
MASIHHSFEDCATAIAWDAGKLLVMERVKVAPPKAMEMRIKVKYFASTEGLGFPLNVANRKIILSCLLASLLLKVEKYLRRQSIGLESVDLKPKRFDEVYNVHTT